MEEHGAAQRVGLQAPKLGLSVLMPHWWRSPSNVIIHTLSRKVLHANSRRVMKPLNAFDMVEQGRNQPYGGV